jgi:Putative capsular polysaccharide synthesis protein/Sulfotransferase family
MPIDKPGVIPGRLHSINQMRRIIKSVRHAASLLRNLGLRRFLIVLLYWTLRKYRPVLGAPFERMCGSFNRDKISRDPVLIYQMPKVGSTSLLYSLQLAYVKLGLPNVGVYHLHTLTNLDVHEQLARESNSPSQQLAIVREYKKILTDLQSPLNRHWTAITMVRDPVARQVSHYFHHIDSHLPDWRRRWRERSLTLDEVMQNFLSAPDHTPQWFDAEVKSILGIDVFASPFPHEAGYNLYSRPPKVTLLLIRVEDMNRVVDQAVKQLLGINGFKLHLFNTAKESSYWDLYKQFKAIPLPAGYVENAYSGRLARHFYTQAERDQFAKKWTHAGAETAKRTSKMAFT